MQVNVGRRRPLNNLALAIVFKKNIDIFPNSRARDWSLLMKKAGQKT